MVRRKSKSESKSTKKEYTRKSSSKKVEEAPVSTSDFKAKVATVASFDVTNIAGATKIGKGRTLTAYACATVTEVSATLSFEISSITNAPGQTVTLLTTSPITIGNTTVTTISAVSGQTSNYNYLSGLRENSAAMYWNGERTSVTYTNSGASMTGTLSIPSTASSFFLTATAAIPTSVYFATSSNPGTAPGYYKLRDDGAGVLNGYIALSSYPFYTSTSAVTGTIDYNTGAWKVDIFNTGNLFTTGGLISAAYKYTFTQTTTAATASAIPIRIRHAVGPDAPLGQTEVGRLSGNTVDPIVMTTGLVSTIFTLSATGAGGSNPWTGRGALPGETRLETAGRLIDEGVI